MTAAHRLVSALILALGLVAGLPAALAAAEAARVSGRVVDENGALLSGARVVLTRPGTAFSQEKSSDAKGQVMLVVLDATVPYQVRVEKAGFEPFEGPLEVQPGANLRLTFTLVHSAPAAAAATPPP